MGNRYHDYKPSTKVFSPEFTSSFTLIHSTINIRASNSIEIIV